MMTIDGNPRIGLPNMKAPYPTYHQVAGLVEIWGLYPFACSVNLAFIHNLIAFEDIGKVIDNLHVGYSVIQSLRRLAN
jgi:hypothetical protein